MIAQEFYLPIVNPVSEQAGNHHFSPSPTTTTPRRRRSLPHLLFACVPQAFDPESEESHTRKGVEHRKQ